MERTIRSSPFLLACDEIIRHVPTPPHKLLTPHSFPAHAGHYSCLRAHLAIIEQAYADGLQSLLILEDDIDPEPDFEAQMPVIMRQLPTDWLMLYLGGTSQQAHHPLQGRLAVLGGATSTHAYALSRAGMEVCADWCFMQKNMPLIRCTTVCTRLGCTWEIIVVCVSSPGSYIRWTVIQSLISNGHRAHVPVGIRLLRQSTKKR